MKFLLIAQDTRTSVVAVVAVVVVVAVVLIVFVDLIIDAHVLFLFFCYLTV